MFGHKILVTGGAGFIGSHIAHSLLSLGHTVVVLDNLNDYYDVSMKHRNLACIKKAGDFTFVHDDIENRSVLDKLIETYAIDTIYHLAAQPGVFFSVSNPIVTNRVNVAGTINVLEAAVKGGVERVINASSSSVYGGGGRTPLDETRPAKPISPYGASKLASEHYCTIFNALHDLSVVSLRYFTVYGPRMRPDLAISIFIRKARSDNDIEIFGTGEDTRDYTFIDDIVEANLMFLDRKESGIYNVGSGSSICVNDLVKKIINLTHSGSRTIHVSSRPGDVEDTLADMGKFTRKMGWRPQTGLDTGLSRYVEFVRSGMSCQ